MRQLIPIVQNATRTLVFGDGPVGGFLFGLIFFAISIGCLVPIYAVLTSPPLTIGIVLLIFLLFGTLMISSGALSLLLFWASLQEMFFPVRVLFQGDTITLSRSRGEGDGEGAERKDRTERKETKEGAQSTKSPEGIVLRSSEIVKVIIERRAISALGLPFSGMKYQWKPALHVIYRKRDHQGYVELLLRDEKRVSETLSFMTDHHVPQGLTMADFTVIPYGNRMKALFGDPSEIKVAPYEYTTMANLKADFEAGPRVPAGYVSSHSLEKAEKTRLARKEKERRFQDLRRKRLKAFPFYPIWLLYLAAAFAITAADVWISSLAEPANSAATAGRLSPFWIGVMTRILVFTILGLSYIGLLYRVKKITYVLHTLIHLVIAALFGLLADVIVNPYPNGVVGSFGSVYFDSILIFVVASFPLYIAAHRLRYHFPCKSHEEQ